MSYSDYQAKLAPGWLQGDNGGKWQRTLGAEKDVQLEMNRQAVLADIPGSSPADAIYLIGADRVLPPAVSEDPALYAERLRTCWDSADGWAFAGSHGGLLKALSRAGFPATGILGGAVIVQRTLRYSYLDSFGVVQLATHSGWTFNYQGPEIWNQFGIIFGTDVPSLTVGSSDALKLDATVKAWKPAKARFMGTEVVVSGSIWGWPFGVTWGGARTWGGVSRFIPSL
jgi:hypothetical protein